MNLATWWKSDPLPILEPLPGFRVTTVDDATLSRLNSLPLSEVRARRADGHRPYIAVLHGSPVGYGWAATRQASIGELALSFSLPDGDRYLWDFRTFAAWQGLGIYPRLLQGIIRAERDAAERFWILHAPENLPSGAGMRKAGFRAVSALAFDPAGKAALGADAAGARVEEARRLLGIPLAPSALSPCWRCVHEEGACRCQRAGTDGADTCCCAVKPRAGKAKEAARMAAAQRRIYAPAG